jgi:membrane protease YdiL (CAAX protease family)
MKKPTELKIIASVIIFTIATIAEFVLFGLGTLMLNKIDYVPSSDGVFNFYLASCLIVDSLIIVIVLPWFNVGILDQFRNVRFNLLIMIMVMSVFVLVLVQPIVDPIDFVKKLTHQQLTITGLNISLSLLTKFDKIIYLILMVLITPIVEEIVYRGFLFNLLLKKYSVKLALIISSLIFAFFHLRFAGIGFLFVYGLFFGYVYYKTNSLIAPILAHFTINFLASFSAHSVVDLNSGSLTKYLLIFVTSLFLIFIFFSLINKKGILLISDNEE